MASVTLLGLMVLIAGGVVVLAVIGGLVGWIVSGQNRSSGQRVLGILAFIGLLIVGVPLALVGAWVFLGRSPAAANPLDGAPDTGLLIVIAAGLALVAVLICVSVGLAVRQGHWSAGGILAEFAGLLWIIPVLAVCGFLAVRAAPHLWGGPLAVETEPVPEADVDLGEEATTPPKLDDVPMESDPEKSKPPAEQEGKEKSPESSADADLPEWIREKRVEAGDGRVLVVLSSGQYVTTREAEIDVLDKAVHLLKEDFEAMHPDQGSWMVPANLVRSEAVRRKHVENLERTIGGHPVEMHRVHWQVEVSPEVRDELEGVWRKQIASRRLWVLGTLFGELTLMIAAVGMYLRLDTLTSGAYRRRLKLAAVLLIVAGGLVGVVLLPGV